MGQGAEQRLAAREFIEAWLGKGDEKQDTQRFWLGLLRTVLGVKSAETYIQFEMRVKLGNVSFIDGYIPSAQVLIEQKGKDIDLDKAYAQSDGTPLTPYQQARRYAGYLPYDKPVRWICVCNFQEFRVYDMKRPDDAPEIIKLADLEKEYHRLSFLTDSEAANLKREMEISFQAGAIIGDIYEALLKAYIDPTAEHSLKSLNALCVRLVFCLYAEDTELFGRRLSFHDYLRKYRNDAREALIRLFKVLDTPPDERDPYLNDDLAAFPYVNGGLFADENIEIPRLSVTVTELILKKASEDFDWSGISPTIFGALFESTLNPVTRRAGGMHYTSIENIHKVIDPLFLDDLKAELAAIKAQPNKSARTRQLKAYQDKLASIVILDPASGSGNFLTESYMSLRRLENEAVRELKGDQILLGLEEFDPIKVSISQFYGIEINDFAVTVARTALWIAEHQMMKETENIIGSTLDLLPLTTSAHITEGNALRLDWANVAPKEKLKYIIGNPPFVGHQWRTKLQQEDMDNIFYDFGSCGKLDYAAAWHKKSTDFILNTDIECAFVSTNSLVQGESVAVLWKPLLLERNIVIIFAWQSFAWNSESNLKAHVHCVIIGFRHGTPQKEKKLYTANCYCQSASNINGYLLDAPNIFIENRGNPLISGFPKMSKGSQPTDGGNLLLTNEERKEISKKYPKATKLIKKYISADDFINNRDRFCIWLKDVSPHEYANIPPIVERLEKVRQVRLKSPTKSVKKDADTPMLFTQIRQPQTTYLVVPEVSSEKRSYIPIGFMTPDIIASNMVYLVPNATLFMFGVIVSIVHMAWMRTVCGRLEMRYRYTPAVYNNFPWITPTDKRITEIEEKARKILEVRAKFPEVSLAVLYKDITMPPELRRAHQANDKAVLEAYGLRPDTPEAEIVQHLFRLYTELTLAESAAPAASAPAKKRKPSRQPAPPVMSAPDAKTTPPTEALLAAEERADYS